MGAFSFPTKRTKDTKNSRLSCYCIRLFFCALCGSREAGRCVLCGNSQLLFWGNVCYVMKLSFLVSLLFFASICHSQEDTLDILFDTDSYELKQEEIELIDQVLKPSPSFNGSLELRGHCDSRGSDAYNIRLSQNRVRSVRQYLLSKGFPEKNIIESIGYGERHPMADNNTEEGRALNRRVELIFTAGKKPEVVTLKEKLSDTTLTVGSNITLRNINFEGGRSIFLRESYPILKELLDAMLANPTLVIRIEGHICCQQGDADGMDMGTGYYNLSEARARAVQDFLIQNGVAASRLSFKGFGHSRPLYPYPERTDEERTANRRVELKIISR